MIDLHTHILPGVDDGSKSAEESAQMLRLSWEQGVSLMAATPHFYPQQDMPEAFLSRRQAAVDRLSYDTADMPKLLLGAEVAYFNGIGSSKDMRCLCIGDSSLMLVEMPFRPWTSREIADVCGLQNLGIVPVLAHIDRYDKKGQLFTYLDTLLGEGVLLQCNGVAFSGRFSSAKWLRLLAEGKIAFLGSDCHNMGARPPALDKAMQVISKKLGQGFLEMLEQQGKYLLKV